MKNISLDYNDRMIVVNLYVNEIAVVKIENGNK